MTVVARLFLICLLAFGALALVAAPGTVAAQDRVTLPEADYEDWDKTATRAEGVVNDGRASSDALEELRAQLVEWRQRFQNAQAANSSTISTVQGQLKALGPVPENGSESEDIAALRSELVTRLSQLQVPVKRAELAYSRADGLIRGIDTIIRKRQAKDLLVLGPSPLNPAYWDDAIAEVYGAWRRVQLEIQTAWDNPVRRSATMENLPKVLLFLAIGVALVLRGRLWCRRLSRRILRQGASAGRWLMAFVVSVGEFVLPYVGAMLIVGSAFATGLTGLRGDQVLEALLGAFFIYFLARWLTVRIFPFGEHRMLPLALDHEQRQMGRRLGTGLGLIIAFISFLDEMAEVFGWSEATSIVTVFPVMVLAALMLWWLARLLKIHSNAGEKTDDESYRNRLARLMGPAILVLAVAAPSLAAIGYFNAAEALMLPALLTLMLLAVLVVLQRLVDEIYILVSGNQEGAADSLTPVLAGLVLILLSTPVFALIWGARVADLTELWTRFTNGVQLGGIQISPTIFVTLAAVFAAGFLITRFIQGTLKTTVLPKTRLDVGGQNAIVSGIGYVGIFLSAVIAISSAGIDLSSLAIVAGALSVGIGFGLQNIVSNFVSGIILLIERPISEGDWIDVNGSMGYVRDISVRSTRIETFDRTDVIVPNADLVSGTVTNYTRGNTVGRVIVPVGVAYGTDTRRVETILREIAEAHPMVLANPAPNVVMMGFGADSLDFQIRAILRDVNWVLSVQSDMNHEIARRFVEEGIEIPFAQRDLWLRNPEVLSAGSAGPAAGPAAPAKPKPARVKKNAQKDSADSPGDGGDADK